MSRRYDRLLQEQLTDQEISAESIPHLLHQDLAYRWILNLDPNHRPEGWRDRIGAWRQLLHLFFIGELDLERMDASRYPLGRLLATAGLQEVYWLRTRTGSGTDATARIVGVTSPTVLVRPLPTFTDDLRNFVARIVAERQRPDELKYFAALAAQKLVDIGTVESIGLATIIEREFGVERHTHLAAQRAGGHIDLPILTRIDWSGASEFATVPIFTRRDTESSWAPQCSTCGNFLTQTQADAPVDVPVGASVVTVVCRCGAPNDVPLQRLLIWQRSPSETIVWTPTSAIMARKPPRPALDNIDVKFEWTAAELRGDVARRWLRLRFAGRSVRSMHVDECFFKRLVVIGDRRAFRGLPVRPEWLDALEDPSSAAESVEHRETVTEYSIALNGYPERIRQRYTTAELAEHGAAAIGIFPDPRVVGSRWRRYRGFVAGTTALTPIAANGWKGSPFPTLVESDQGCPTSVSVVESQAPSAGATFLYSTLADEPTARAVVSIDFGTSNTLVYTRTPDGGASGYEALNPGVAKDVTLWFGEHVADTGPILPVPNRQTRDASIIPSALWVVDSLGVIRWGSHPPAPTARPRTGFKWDARHIGEDLTRYRRMFLLEVLNTTLPLVAHRLGHPVGDIELGVTFPLAFDHEQKRRFSSLLDELKSDVRRLFGIHVTSIYSISESAACVAAFGTPAEGETYLIADMGGGTLDLALLTMVDDAGRGVRPDIHQIGSVKLGGEEFVRALARSDNAAEADTEWLIRDRIAGDDADVSYGRDPRVKAMLQRFTAIAFEFLRTMLLAYREFTGQSSVRLLLVGNGWHLVDAFSDERRAKGPNRVWTEFYEYVLRQLGVPGLTLHTDPDFRVPSKHLAAIGALKNVTVLRRRDLVDESEPVRLPAGRTLRFGPAVVTWPTLVGNGAPLNGVDPAEVRPGNLSVEAGVPKSSASWDRYFGQSFGVAGAANVPTTSAARLRERLAENLHAIGPTLAVGPLQVIVEDAWLPTLAEIH